jgi:uncharacterized protein (TIGR00156 family)
MRKSLYVLPAVLLFGVSTTWAQLGKDTESEQRNRPETQKPQDPSGSQPGAQQSQSGARSPAPMGSDTEKEQRQRPESTVGKEGGSGEGQSTRQSKSAGKNAPAVTTASAVAAAQNDQPVRLRGKIVSKQKGNEYMFQDNTGNVLVEIGSKAVKGSNKQLAAGTEVEIQGEVDTRKGKPAKVDAKQVSVLAAAGGASGSSSGRSGSSSDSSAPSRNPSPSGSSSKY